MTMLLHGLQEDLKIALLPSRQRKKTLAYDAAPSEIAPLARTFENVAAALVLYEHRVTSSCAHDPQVTDGTNREEAFEEPLQENLRRQHAD